MRKTLFRIVAVAVVVCCTGCGALIDALWKESKDHGNSASIENKPFMHHFFDSLLEDDDDDDDGCTMFE